MGSILYIHGYNSSPKGKKGQELKELMLDLGAISRFRAPNLMLEPSLAIKELERLVIELGTPTLIGSSLGGYYATYLAHKFNLKALLINPAVLPHRLLGESYVDKQTWQEKTTISTDYITKMLKQSNGSDQSFINSYIQELVDLEVDPPKDKERYKVWLKSGDEVLDYRFAKDWYEGCDISIDEGGEHQFYDFAEKLPTILKWADL